MGQCWRNPQWTCLPPSETSLVCVAYNEDSVKHCMLLDAIVAHKRMADKVTETAAQIAQQIEFGQHPK